MMRICRVSLRYLMAAQAMGEEATEAEPLDDGDRFLIDALHEAALGHEVVCRAIEAAGTSAEGEADLSLHQIIAEVGAAQAALAQGTFEAVGVVAHRPIHLN